MDELIIICVVKHQAKLFLHLLSMEFENEVAPLQTGH